MKISDCIFGYNFRFIGLYVLFTVFAAIPTSAQGNSVDQKLALFSSFEEVPIEIQVDGKWSFETNAIITDSNLLFVNVMEVFTHLKIMCNESTKGNTLEGFIENEKKSYSIDYDTKQIKVGNNTIHSTNGLLEETGIKYIEASVLSEAFGLTLTFNPRSLSAKLVSSFELPYVKQLRIENARNSISKLQGQEIVVDTIIPRNYHLFKFGMLDWGFNSNQTVNNTSTNNVIVGVGSELLFGEANISINYNDKYQFDNRQLQYSWRWIDNDKKLIKQAQVGKIYNQSIAFLEAPVVGATINNSPNTVRKASGSYTINDYTEPNWTVELYINDVLVDYTAADASGLYVFSVPIVYGYTALKLKFYGPLGEERTEERIINTPYTFIPAKTLEYSMSAGVLQDENGSRYGQGNFNYGVNRFLTLGGGVEYLSSISNRPFIPFAKAAFQPFSQLVMNLEYAHDVKMKGLLDYYFTKSAFLELDYTKYVKGQLATRFNALEERKVRISVPFKINHFSGFSKLNFSQFVYDSFNFNQIDFVFSTYYRQLSVNSSTLVNWIGNNSPFMINNLSLSYRLFNGLVLRPSVEYNLSNSMFTRYRAEIEKRVSKMYFSASYERSIVSKTDAVFLNFRYDLSYARTGVSSYYTNKSLSFSENAQGSFAFGGDNNYVHSGNNSALGKGGILFYPFLDLNQNGKFDKDEKMVLLSSVRVSGGTAVISAKDSIVRVSDLNSFVNYNVEFSDTDLQNISWKFKHKSYQVLVDPNQYKRIFVPIISLGEVNGTVYLNKENANKGLGRVTVQIYDSKGKKVTEILSESDGYFSYLGLKPGKYLVRIDEKQLKKLNYQALPKAHEATIEISEDGAIVEGLDFNLSVTELVDEIKTIISDANLQTKEVEELIENKIETIIPEAILQTNKGILSERVIGKRIEGVTDTEELFYSIQLGVYKDHSMQKEFKNLDLVFYEDLPNGNVEYYYGFFRTYERALIAKNTLSLRGINGTSVVTYQFGKKIKAAALTNIKKGDESKEDILIKTEEQINNRGNTSFEKISDQQGLFYSVQIGVFKNYVHSKYFSNFKPVFYEFLSNDRIRYISGKYNSKKEAKAVQNRIIAKGIKKAYIVKYKDGKKVDTSNGGH